MAKEKAVLVERRRWISTIAVLLLVAGVGALFFPSLIEQRFVSNTADMKKEFLLRAQSPPTLGSVGKESPVNNSAYDALYELLQAENEKLYLTGQTGLTDAFAYEQPKVDLSAYGIENNCIGFVMLPTIGAELPIYLGASTDNLKKGAVHMTYTSYPIGGINTNCVIAAHRGRATVLLRNIHKVRLGDEVVITNFKEKLYYRAKEIKIIQPHEVDEILIQDGRDMITLISCHPLGSNAQRYVLYCERIT